MQHLQCKLWSGKIAVFQLRCWRFNKSLVGVVVDVLLSVCDNLVEKHQKVLLRKSLQLNCERKWQVAIAPGQFMQQHVMSCKTRKNKFKYKYKFFTILWW